MDLYFDMKRTLSILRWAFYGPMACALSAVILFETGTLPVGVWESEEMASTELYLEFAMILLTIGGIPFVLRLLKFPSVARRLAEDSTEGRSAYGRYALIRLLLMAVLLLLNLLLYYLFMNVRFGYLAIILFISSMFIHPSAARMERETE